MSSVMEFDLRLKKLPPANSLIGKLAVAYDDTLQLSTFKTYLAAAIGEMNMSYIDEEDEEIELDGEEEFQEFMKLAINKKTVLLLDWPVLCATSEGNETQRDTCETKPKSECLVQPPLWFKEYMMQFQTNLLKEIREIISETKAEQQQMVVPDCATTSNSKTLMEAGRVQLKRGRGLAGVMKRVVRGVAARVDGGAEPVVLETPSGPPLLMDWSFVDCSSNIEVMRIRAGAVFTKTWYVLNCGERPWTDKTELRHTWGLAALVPAALNFECPKLLPGERGHLSVTFTAFGNPGSHESVWHFYDTGKKFGQCLSCMVVIEPREQIATLPQKLAVEQSGGELLDDWLSVCPSELDEDEQFEIVPMPPCFLPGVPFDAAGSIPVRFRTVMKGSKQPGNVSMGVGGEAAMCAARAAEGGTNQSDDTKGGAVVYMVDAAGHCLAVPSPESATSASQPVDNKAPEERTQFVTIPAESGTGDGFIGLKPCTVTNVRDKSDSGDLSVSVSLSSSVAPNPRGSSPAPFISSVSTEGEVKMGFPYFCPSPEVSQPISVDRDVVANSPTPISIYPPLGNITLETPCDNAQPNARLPTMLVDVQHKIPTAESTPVQDEQVVNILPETLVNGAINMASSAITTACSVISGLRSRSEEAQVVGSRAEYGMQLLLDMGFHDLAANEKRLQQYNNDIPKVVESMLRYPPPTHVPSP